jgi:phage terminase large subunit-like protein
MEVARRQKRQKEATLTIVGQGASTVLGYRTDWTICDDVVTEKNSASPTQRIKMREWFDLAVETGPQHVDSRLTVVGTRFDPHDLYGDLIEITNPDSGAPHWRKQHEDAVADEEKKLSLWPEEWPWDRLMLKKESIGTLSFNKRYRNIAVDSSRMVVKEEYVKGGWRGNVHYPGCLDRQYRIGDFAPDWRVACGFDPAAGGTRMAKFCSHTTLALGSCKEHERCYWLIDLDRGQYTLPQQVQIVIDAHQRYQASKTLIEANAYQIGLYQAVQLETDKRGLAINVEPHYTSRTNKPDPELGVQAMAPWFEGGKVHIPWGDNHSQRKMRLFVDELVQFPDGRTTDTVMSFWFAWRDLQITAPLFKSFNRLDTTHTAWGPRAPRMGTRVVKNPYYLKRGSVA